MRHCWIISAALAAGVFGLSSCAQLQREVEPEAPARVQVPQEEELDDWILMVGGERIEYLLAQRERHAKGNLIMLAPPVYIDGWATPWYRFLRPVLYAVPGLPLRMKIEEEDPFGIKNEQLRAIVKAKFQRGENFHYQWVPLECIRQVDRLRAMVMKAASHIHCPTLVMHAREDELTSLRSAHFMVESIGGGRARIWLRDGRGRDRLASNR